MDEKWLKGEWMDYSQLRGCIDPTRCFHDPPGIPQDEAVIKVEDSNDFNLGDSVLYSLRTESEYRLDSRLPQETSFFVSYLVDFPNLIAQKTFIGPPIMPNT